MHSRSSLILSHHHWKLGFRAETSSKRITCLSFHKSWALASSGNHTSVGVKPQVTKFCLLRQLVDHVLKSYPFLTWSTCTKVLSENDLEHPQARNATDHSDWLKTSLAFPHSGKNGCGQSGSQPRIRCPEHHNFLSQFQLLQKQFSSLEEQLPSTSTSSMERVRGTFLQTA